MKLTKVKLTKGKFKKILNKNNQSVKKSKYKKRGGMKYPGHKSKTQAKRENRARKKSSSLSICDGSSN